MEELCKVLAKKICEQVAVTQNTICINLKNVPESLVNVRLKNKLEKHLNPKTDPIGSADPSIKNESESCLHQTKFVASTYKGWIYLIMLWISLTAGIVLMCTGYWWGIIGVFASTVLLMKEIVNPSTTNDMNRYSLKLKLYFALVQVPPRDGNCSNMKFIPIWHQLRKNQSAEEFFNRIVVENFQNTLGINNVEELVKWSNIAQRSEATYDDYSYLKHSRKVIYDQVPIWVIVLFIILGIIASLVGAFYYRIIIIAVISTSSITAFLAYIYRFLTIKDKNISIKDKAECLENIRLFHRWIKNENVYFVILLDQASASWDQCCIFLEHLKDLELNNLVLVVNEAPATFPYKLQSLDPELNYPKDNYSVLTGTAKPDENTPEETITVVSETGKLGMDSEPNDHVYGIENQINIYTPVYSHTILGHSINIHGFPKTPEGSGIGNQQITPQFKNKISNEQPPKSSHFDHFEVP